QIFVCSPTRRFAGQISGPSAYTTSTVILETWFLCSLDLTSCSKRVGSTPIGRYRRNTMRPLSSYSEELCSLHLCERSRDCTASNTGLGSSVSSSRILTSQLECESSQNISNQLKAVTNTAMAHDPMPHASPTTTIMIALPVSFGFSSRVLNRSSAPMPKMTNASVWLVPLSSATSAPTTPSSMRALRSSKSFSGSRSDARRGCHAIAKAQPTARVRLRKSRSINEGCANCSRLFSIDSHELPLGSTPPPAPALAISSAGLLPKTVEENKPRKAMTTMMLAIRSARVTRKLEEQRCASFTQVELTNVSWFRVRNPRRITFDMFISLESLIV